MAPPLGLAEIDGYPRQIYILKIQGTLFVFEAIFSEAWTCGLDDINSIMLHRKECNGFISLTLPFLHYGILVSRTKGERNGFHTKNLFALFSIF